MQSSEIKPCQWIRAGFISVVGSAEAGKSILGACQSRGWNSDEVRDNPGDGGLVPAVR